MYSFPALGNNLLVLGNFLTPNNHMNIQLNNIALCNAGGCLPMGTSLGMASFVTMNN